VSDDFDFGNFIQQGVTAFSNAAVGALGTVAGAIQDTEARLSGRRQGVADPQVEGSLERGPRPTGQEIRGAQLQVPGDVDHARAQADAEKVLASLDFTKPNLVLWVPATGSHAIPGSFRDAVDRQFGQRASLGLVDYPAEFNFNDSVSTGMETLRLVLAGIAERGGNHRVTLAGHSQGAWVIGDAIDTPELARSVDRAVLYGHPSPARVDWSKAGDPNVRQVDDPGDPFAAPIEGGRQALDAIDQLRSGTDGAGQPLDLGDQLGRVGQLAKIALANPRLSVYLLEKHIVPADWDNQHDPHHYDEQYGAGARFLDGLPS
jgi:hypothetical protein